MPITPVDEQTTNNSNTYPQLDTSLPAYQDIAPTRQGQPAYTGTNPYAPGSKEYDVYGTYNSYLGRDPENSQVVSSWAANPNFSQGIRDSYEAQTSGRARNEVNSLYDSQIQALNRQAQIQQQQAQNQLGALNPAYQDQFNSLNYGLNSNQNTINQQLAQMAQEYDVNSGRLGQQLGQVPLQAFQMANRRGLLDSSIAYDTLGRLAQPIQNSLSDLARAYTNNRSTTQTKLSDLVEKYNLDRNTLVSKRSQEAESIRNNLALALSQFQTQASQQEAQRNAQVYARSGELGDQYKQFGLQNQQVQSYIQDLAQKQQLAQQQFALQQQQLRKSGQI